MSGALFGGHGSLAFVELPRALAQYMAQLGDYLSCRSVFYSLRPEVRSTLRRCGVAVAPATYWLPTDRRAPSRSSLEPLGYKHDAADPRTQAIAVQLDASLRGFFDRHDVRGLFVWNGSGLTTAVAVALARERGLPVLFGENGYLPGTLQLDHQGVNAHSSARARVLAGAYRGCRLAPDEQALLDAALASLRSGLPLPSTPPAQRVMPSLLGRAKQELNRPLTPARWATVRPSSIARAQLPPDMGGYVLLPLQVLGDSQLLLHSPLVGNDLPGLVMRLSASLQRVAPQLRLLVKLHPAEAPDRLAAYRGLAARCPNTVWIRSLPAVPLVLGAAAVVTVNSTVGFEALVLGKPVLTLGDNFYSAEPLVHTLTQLDALDSRLHDCLSQAPATPLRREFLAWTWQHLLVRASYRDFSERSFVSMAAAVQQRLMLSSVVAEAHPRMARPAGASAATHAPGPG